MAKRRIAGYQRRGRVISGAPSQDYRRQFGFDGHSSVLVRQHGVYFYFVVRELWVDICGHHGQLSDGHAFDEAALQQKFIQNKARRRNMRYGIKEGGIA